MDFEEAVDLSREIMRYCIRTGWNLYGLTAYLFSWQVKVGDERGRIIEFRTMPAVPIDFEAEHAKYIED